MNDTVDENPNAQEQAKIELAKTLIGKNIDDLNDLDGDDIPILIYEIEHKISVLGRVGGSIMFDLFEQRIPERLWGTVIVLFSGYADTTKELFEIECCREFMRGFIFGVNHNPCRAQARKALRIMCDENKMGQIGSQLTGLNYVISLAFGGHSYVRDRTSESGWSRNVELVNLIRNYILSDDSDDPILLNLLMTQ